MKHEPKPKPIFEYQHLHHLADIDIARNSLVDIDNPNRKFEAKLNAGETIEPKLFHKTHVENLVRSGKKKKIV